MTPPMSRHGSALLDLDSSILSNSATASGSSAAASASSDILRQQQDNSTTNRQFELSQKVQQGPQQPQPQPPSQPHHRSHPQSAILELDHESIFQNQSTSDTDIHHRRLASGHNVSNSLASLNSGILAPLKSTVVSASPPPLPQPLFKSPPIRRKPLSSSASSLASSLRLRDSACTIPPLLDSELLPQPEQRFARPPSIDSPTFYDYSHSLRTSIPPPIPAATTLPGTQAPTSESYIISGTGLPLHQSAEVFDALSEYDDLIPRGSSSSVLDEEELVQRPAPGIAAEDHNLDELESLYAEHFDLPPIPPMFASKPPPPHLKLDTVDPSAPQNEFGSGQSRSPDSARLAASPQLNKALPKSPGQSSPFATLFGWPNISPSVTEFSSIPSPLYPSKDANDTHPTPGITRSDSSLSQSNGSPSNPVGYCESYLATPPPGTADSSAQLDEMEDELRAISSELAASIRREMDLEDLVDRLQEQVSNPQAPNKRSSDYFSDSGYSSAKASEYDHGREEVEKMQRRSQQENASIRLELTNKLQTERSRRKILDQQIKELAEKASQMDLAVMNNLDANDRVKELEKSCEDLRRRLAEERESKSNIEDLLSGLKSELQEVCTERDNLREEVVPQLRAKVEGLEVQAASFANLTYESTKIQHQLHSLKEENTSLRRSMGPEDKALARSNSVAASSFKARGPSAYNGLSRSRSTSVKNAQAESRESLAERLKDVEAQRDALHSALKNLLERQEYQNRENDKKIKVLEAERQRLLLEPRKAGFDREISHLRTEINVLRRRAEDALEQKWQLEKGLGGLKMDLDRAEEEIASLRSLLEEKDILIPPSSARSSVDNDSMSAPVTSESLQLAYQDLQSAYIESLERIKDLELNAGGEESDEKTKLAIERLEQSLSLAISERDATQRHLNGVESHLDELSASEAHHVEREMALADQLSASAQRVEQFALQVQQQLATNAELRKRLADTVARGDSERKANSNRITDLQARLHVLEEQLVAAQTSSEDRVFRHEEELAELREAHNSQLRRINNGGVVGITARKGTLLKARASKASFLSRFGQSMSAKSFEEEVEIRALRGHVTDLEKALADAENEMQHVVARMNEAQVEVMNLQEEREMAARETRNLQNMVKEATLMPPGGRAL
ncbi:hypothetical protein E4U21_001930 [Claviceps maximensis]|nr:hypothetical protein E4U21_001930 [Claviceps maximensis]